jgi:hypothetical protein
VGVRVLKVSAAVANFYLNELQQVIKRFNWHPEVIEKFGFVISETWIQSNA